MSVAHRNPFVEREQPGRIAVGQRFDQCCVHEGKNGGAASDGQREYRDRGEGEGGFPA